MDLNKYTNTNKSEILHTSGHARAAQGDSIGSSGGQTFQQRLDLSKRARTVGEYRYSRVGSRNGPARRLPRVDGASVISAGSSSDPIPGRRLGNRGSSIATNAQSQQPQRRTFVEPPKRHYNPYE